MNNNRNLDIALKSIDDVTEFNILRYDCTDKNEECFYLLEQSSLQILRELPLDFSLEVQEIFSQRHRVSQRIDTIKSCTTIKDFLDVVLPLVENGSFPCDNLAMTINQKLYLESHDDGEVTLMSNDKSFIYGLTKNILARQGFNPRFLNEIVRRPNLFHKLERPDIIITSYQTFEEVLDSF